MRAVGETIHGRTKLIGGVVMLATPVRSAVDLSLRIHVDILHNELEELFESGTINDVTNVFLILDSSTILVSIQILIGILDDLQDTLRDKIIFYLRLQLSGNPEYGASNNMKIKGRTIHVPLNKSEFAHYLNVNRTSLCRELSSMEKDGLITVDGDNYTLIPRKDEHEVPPQDLP